MKAFAPMNKGLGHQGFLVPLRSPCWVEAQLGELLGLS